MKKYNFLQSAKNTFQIEAKAVSDLSNQLDSNFEKLCLSALESKGKLVIMGIGKSGHIGQKIAATLSSTGTKSVFIHPTEAAHGDMGLIGKEDIVILISNSGETDEIINIMPSIKRLSKLIASISSNQMSTMAKGSDIAIVIKSEEACPLDLAPTSSTTAALAFGDALAIALLEAKGFTKDDFASSHPAGKLGRKLITRVSDLMHKGDELPKVSKGTLLTNALLEMSEKKLGVTLVNSGNNIIGIFSDGDLRRCINNSINIDTTYIEEVMTKNFIKISSDELAIDAAKLMEENKIFVLAVESNDDEIVGILSMHDLIQARII
ncbi:MAG: KpsF/GutQ family sugar-phosphate isomerase [Gammaproteobacteria bacterium]|jgi:arabinose-5-phosphate isomerase|tara:strand:- start:269 stop:1234 length:966 start_codon:yes stop_codon:yes gene_type:complete